MAAEEEKKATPCPVCHSPLMLRYDQEDSHAMQDPVSGRIRIPMRCGGCGINLEIAVDPKDLEDEEPA
ncbi:hypothetical protein LCGC14_0823590 [marine sediment metagenome]|uniref:Uncharacterized protein n=1 Tax=marine sediment metagenome TaxID=412755 RepID=A0A0F9S2Y6_9ZZZZ